MSYRVATQEQQQPQSSTPLTSKALQRKCACGNHTGAGGECESCRARREGALQRAGMNVDAMTGVPPIVHEVLRSPGQPLDAGTREFMEPRFGHDFSGVRVHTNAKAAESSQAVNALAYTVGRDVVFGSNRYNGSDSGAGRTLLAHELTHVVQQATGASFQTAPAQIGNSDNPLELEAQRLAAHVMNSDLAPEHRERASHAAHPETVYRQLIPVPGSPVPVAGPFTGLNPFPASPPAPMATPPTPAVSPSVLANELQTLIDGATWKEIRKRVYPKESAPGINRAKERKAGKLADLTGLGRIKTLEHFATAVRGIQTKWPALSPSKRVNVIGDAANAELKAAEVPEFLIVDKEPMEFKGFFRPSEWKFVISEALVNSSSLGNDDAADVANTSLHESRHAEQNFLAARYSAGANKKDASQIVLEQGIPKDIAEKAVQKKFDAKTDPAVAELGKRMYQADVTDAAKNQAISNDDGLTELGTKRTEAQLALDKLKASATPATIADATAKKNSLSAQITVVEQRYTLYRNIPYEADAHEVGDAAGEAFKRTP